MPGGILSEENLEERIERIRKRDEEIEKKHREAEEDRLAALEANAMVKTTAPTDEDWPKAHKYDKVDFTYDLKPEDLEELAKKNEETRTLKAYKKFKEGEGPPADPTYNFLADSERDGISKKPSDNEKNDWRANNSSPNRRNNNLNNSFNRGRHNGGSGRGKNSMKFQPHQQRNDSNGNGNGNDGQQQKSWKNDESRFNRQKSIEGKWRREWDNDKSDQDIKVSVKSNSATNNERHMKSGQRFKVGGPVNNTRSSAGHSNESENLKQFNSLPQKLSELAIEKRGNITVSVTQDGEVKSVKLETARAIGTGRVGNGMSSSIHANPQSKYPSTQKDGRANEITRRTDQFDNSSRAIYSTAPSTTNPNDAKRSSVQDRLNRNREHFDKLNKNQSNETAQLTLKS